MILKISPHSFVDLVTNSSSELFVCSDKKSVEAVEKVLRRLLDAHNELGDYKVSFDSAFGKIEIAKHSFDYSSMPAALRDEYEKYHDVISYSMWGPCDNESYTNTDRYETLQKKAAQLEAKIGVNENGLYDKDRGEHERRWKLYREGRTKIFAEWNRDAKAAEIAIFRHFCRKNGLEEPVGLDELPRLAAEGNCWWQGAPEVWEDFQDLLNWNISVNKGDILIQSKKDNSIPFGLFGAIESYLGAQRYHLG